jgi:hypothetical protein
MFTIGALFGALSCSWVGGLLGRQKIVFGAAILTFVGEVLHYTSLPLRAVRRWQIRLGWGMGALSATVPMWQPERSSAANRGKHAVHDGFSISLG